MSFFKDFKADFTQAMNELMPDGNEMYDADEQIEESLDKEAMKEASAKSKKAKEKNVKEKPVKEKKLPRTKKEKKDLTYEQTEQMEQSKVGLSTESMTMRSDEEDFDIAPEDMLEQIDDLLEHELYTEESEPKMLLDDDMEVNTMDMSVEELLNQLSVKESVVANNIQDVAENADVEENSDEYDVADEIDAEDIAKAVEAKTLSIDDLLSQLDASISGQQNTSQEIMEDTMEDVRNEEVQDEEAQDEDVQLDELLDTLDVSTETMEEPADDAVVAAQDGTVGEALELSEDNVAESVEDVMAEDVTELEDNTSDEDLGLEELLDRIAGKSVSDEVDSMEDSSDETDESDNMSEQVMPVSDKSEEEALDAILEQFEASTNNKMFEAVATDAEVNDEVSETVEERTEADIVITEATLEDEQLMQDAMEESEEVVSSDLTVAEEVSELEDTEVMSSEEDSNPNIAEIYEFKPAETVVLDDVKAQEETDTSVQDADDITIDESKTDEIKTDKIETDITNEDMINELEDNTMNQENEMNVTSIAAETTTTAVEEQVFNVDEAEAETTLITRGTKLKGDLETEGSIDIIGTVEGNVICKGKVVVGGNVVGNITAGELYANSARIEGTVKSYGSVKVGVGTMIIGGIQGESAVIAGAVNGDIDVNGPVIVDSTAVIMGNIKSRSVQINNGAVIEGFCSQSYSDIDVKSFFA